MSKLPVVNVHNVRKYAPVIYIASLIAISVFFAWFVFSDSLVLLHFFHSNRIAATVVVTVVLAPVIHGAVWLAEWSRRSGIALYGKTLGLDQETIRRHVETGGKRLLQQETSQEQEVSQIVKEQIIDQDEVRALVLKQLYVAQRSKPDLFVSVEMIAVSSQKVGGGRYTEATESEPDGACICWMRWI